MNQITEAMVTIGTAIIGVAILAVLVSKNSNTTGVIQSIASGFGNALGVAESPVTGNQYSIDLSYPTATGGVSSMFGGAMM
jgi:hypothetical protein